MTLSSSVFAITAVSPHTCFHLGPRVPDEHTAEEKTVEDDVAHGDISLKRYKYERSLTSTQLAQALRPDYEKAKRGSQPWNLQSCRCRRSPVSHPSTLPKLILPWLDSPPSLSPRREHILSLDEGAGGTAGLVLRKLRALHALPADLELELVQGLAKCLREAGFGVALHTADGDAVRCQVCASFSRTSPVTTSMSALPTLTTPPPSVASRRLNWQGNVITQPVAGRDASYHGSPRKALQSSWRMSRRRGSIWWAGRSSRPI